ncbi:MarR family winged helix-turn-helix transcriptional regulator [Amycolatopsis sp. H20-H5]|uniref:MarR family winged helix-turn-helix transcriptional regulator n=1 Tax=Amycolatopsis sp. H20-H5 TaxID=3046309 RepID=UPI002DB9D64B|nr:MarR family transcriptional regulator [Amycolatopsis sp. H20-H5]MEC3976478.1 MarR family transcriptional regulator [Amycolatopsis sp. H20-H5]
MVVHPRPAALELSLLSLFAGWALTDELQRRLAEEGFDDLRMNDGVLFQHLIDGPLSISALAERMGVTQQAASKAVADLERRGLLRGEPDPADARTKLVRPTRQAVRAIKATRAHRRTLDAELAAEFGAERVADARALLAAILDRFGEQDAVRGRRVRPPR